MLARTWEGLEYREREVSREQQEMKERLRGPGKGGGGSKVMAVITCPQVKVGSI